MARRTERAMTVWVGVPIRFWAEKMQEKRNLAFSLDLPSGFRPSPFGFYELVNKQSRRTQTEGQLVYAVNGDDNMKFYGSMLCLEATGMFEAVWLVRSCAIGHLIAGGASTLKYGEATDDTARHTYFVRMISETSQLKGRYRP